MPTKKSTPKKPATVTGKPAKGPVKMVTKKVAAKKPVQKKSSKNDAATKKTSRARTEKELVHAKGKEAFWMTDGSILRNLVELRDALVAMEESTYTHHVTSDKNDFADWVECVLQDPDCAAALRKSKKPTSARTVVIRHLKMYRI